MYVFSNVDTWWRDAIRNSVNYTYAPISGFQAYFQLTQADANTDVFVMELNVPTIWPYGVYTTCHEAATFGGGVWPGEYRFCDEQLIVFDPTHEFTTNNVYPKAGNYACHELGHTAGLQHQGLHYNRTTCMDYDWDSGDFLHGHEREHLIECYPRPGTNPPTLTPTCRNYQ